MTNTGSVFTSEGFITKKYEHSKKNILQAIPLPKLSSSVRDEAPISIPISIFYENKSSKNLCFVYKVMDYVLTRPLLLQVSQIDELFVVENSEFNLWGDGKTFDDAYNSFIDFLIYDIESYKNTLIAEMDYFAQLEWLKYKSLLGIE